jgi:hypothetical protein
METNHWKSDIKDWSKISDKTASLMLNQCEALLKETIETAKHISAKAEKLVSILIPIFTLLLAYTLNNYNKLNEFLPLCALLSLIIIGTSIYFSAKNLFQYTISVPGEYPKNIVISQFIDGVEENEQYSQILLYVCENIQMRIDCNEHSNKIRSIDNEISLKILLGLPICPFFAVPIFLLIHLSCF